MEDNLIGAVIGETSTSELSFIVDITKTRERPLQMGEYVSIEFSKRQAIGIITNLRRSNKEIIESLVNSPTAVSRMLKLAMIPGSEVLIATVAVQGFVEGSKGKPRIIKPRFPTLPGARVFRDPTELLSIAFGNSDLEIGVLRGNQDVPVQLNVTNLVSRHFSVLAVTGAGKSYTMGVILDEIMSKLPYASVVVIDPHEDYFYFRDIPKYSNRVTVFTPTGERNTTRLRFRIRNFTNRQLMNIIGLPSNASKQRDLFSRVVDEFNNDRSRLWDFTDLRDTLTAMIADETFKEKEQARGIIRRLRYFAASEFLDRELEIPVASTTEPALTAPGRLTVINTGLLEQSGKNAMVNHILRKIFDAAVQWRQNVNEPVEGDTPALLGPVLIIIEEAHQFAPPGERTDCKMIIQQIAGEGRKFGVGLGIVSQRPGKLDDNVLSQCNTQINLRIVNPRDQNAIENASETMSKDLMRDLPGLNTGEAIITGSAIRIPAMVTVRPLDVTPSGTDIDITSYWNSGGMDEIEYGEEDDDLEAMLD